MKSDWLYNLRWNRSLHFALILTLVIPGMLSGAAILAFRHFGSIAIVQVLTEISVKTGVTVACVGKEIGFGTVRLQGIIVSGFQDLKIEEILSEISLNPFSKSFLKIKTVEVKGLKLVGTNQDPSVVAITKIIEKMTSPAASTEANSESKLNSIQKLFAEEAQVVLTNADVSMILTSDQQSVTVTALHGILNPQLMKFSFFATSISHSSGNSIAQIRGFIELHQPKALKIQIGGPNSASPIGWSTTIDIAPHGSAFTATFDTAGLPEILSSRLQSIVSAPGSLEAQGTVTIEEVDAGKYRFSGTSHFSPLSIQHHIVAKEPIGPIVPAIRYSGTVDTTLRRAVVKKMILTLFAPTVAPKPSFPGIQMGLSMAGDFNNKNSPLGTWSGIVKIPRTSCQTALEVAPIALTPGIKDFFLNGDFFLDADLRFDSQYPDRYFFHPSKLGFGCTVATAPPEYGSERLNNSFRFSKTLPDGSMREFIMDPASTQFTPINLISRNMITAVVSSEDAGFWANDGIDFGAIDMALRNNLKNNKVLSGGSTITMQTVKNLFLSQTRTISRKVQELFLAWHLHNTIKKDRLIEIYLNIIEFGPGIYGIAQASEHFFGKKPFDLNLKEAIYLASVLPSPVRRYRQFCNGKLSPGYEDLVSEKINQMYGQGRISFETATETRALILNFNSLAPAAQYTCLNLETDQKPKKV